MTIRMAERVENMPTYIFSEINAIKKRAADRGVNLLSLAIGDPDQPTPIEIIREIQSASNEAANHQYSPYEGLEDLRKCFAAWMNQRFGVKVSHDKEVIALIGSKEGLAHFPVAFCNPGDAVLYPSPGFPMYASAISMAGGKPVAFSLKYENKFLPELNELETLFRTEKPRFMFLNYPHNPTSAICSKDALTELVQLCTKHNVVIAYDNAYSEIYYDPKNKPISILEIDGAKEIAIEFHSMSKTFNMTGWRLAYAVGNENLVQGLLKVKTNMDSGPVPAVQRAGIYAYNNYSKLTDPIRELYAKRRTVLMKGLDDLRIEYFPPPATFFLWAKVPHQKKSMTFITELIENHGLVLTPGIGFGKEAEYFFRIAMTVDPEKLNMALSRLKDYLAK